MSLQLNYPRLARAVHHFVETNGMVTRAALNSEFRTTSDDKKQEALTLVIRSLLHYGHLQRHFDSASSTVTFWKTGAVSTLPADPVSQGNNLSLEDWLLKPILQGTDVAPKVTTPPVQKPYVGIPVPPKPQTTVEDILRGPASSLTDLEKAEITSLVEGLNKDQIVASPPNSPIQTFGLEMDLAARVAALRARAQELSADQFMLELADEVPMFTLENAYTFLCAKYAKNVISMRISVLLTKGHLFMGMHKRTQAKAYWKPSNPVPEEYEASTRNVTEPVKRTRGPNKKSKHSPVTITRPTEVWPPPEVLTMLGGPVNANEVPVPLDVEPNASMDSQGNLSLLKEDGQQIVFTKKERKALFAVLRYVNVNALYEQI